jgi:hypothetical protein
MALELQDSTTSKPFNDNALSVASRAFQLLVTGPSPLSVDGRSIGHGAPARLIDLGELKALLLGPQAGGGIAVQAASGVGRDELQEMADAALRNWPLS